MTTTRAFVLTLGETICAHRQTDVGRRHLVHALRQNSPGRSLRISSSSNRSSPNSTSPIIFATVNDFKSHLNHLINIFIKIFYFTLLLEIRVINIFFISRTMARVLINGNMGENVKT